MVIKGYSAPRGNLRGEAWRWRGRRLATGEASALAEDLRTKSFVRVERQRAALDKLREALSMRDRMLLALRLDQGLSWKETAEGRKARPPT